MNWLDLTPDEVEHEIMTWLAAAGERDYRHRQIAPRLWTRPVVRWDDVTDLPRTLRERLDRDVPLTRLLQADVRRSADGTVKFLWRLPDGLAVESVWIPEDDRTTLCISSQAGCAFACRFCATGRMGFQRHLAAWEIAGQVREVMLDPAFGKPTNVVFMGMGEPLHNWAQVDRALTLLNDPRCLGIGARRITISTIGLVPRLADLAARPEQFRLAVSLHAATHERRHALMPVEKKFPLDVLIPALRQFEKRLTLEYVMIRGANDADDDATALADLARPLGAHVNLLPLHPGGAPGLEPTPVSDIRRFAKRLEERGVNVTVRRSRGLDIAAACGQLRVETEALDRVHAENHTHVQQ